jgi:threonine dehydrogenase-like Zn-dependent dehydrogenase
VKAVVFAGRERVTVESLPDPAIQESGDAVVRLSLTGICGSDLHAYHEREKGLEPGTVMGHEGVGEIVEVGDGVHGLRPGDRVFSPFTTSCGACPPCASGLTARCERGELFGWRSGGAGLHGMQAELVRVPMASTTLMKIPDGLGDEEALLLGDVFSTGFFCAEMAGAGPGRLCAVVGCGPVGLMAVAASRLLGSERIFAIDSIPERLALAETFGAIPVDRASADPVEAIADGSGSPGVDAVMEVVGSQPAMRLALELIRPGGVLASVGVHTSEHFAFSPAEAYDRNLTFRTGRCPARHYMERLLPVILGCELPLASVITHRLALDDGPEGYRTFDRKLDGCIKVALLP